MIARQPAGKVAVGVDGQVRDSLGLADTGFAVGTVLVKRRGQGRAYAPMRRDRAAALRAGLIGRCVLPRHGGAGASMAAREAGQQASAAGGVEFAGKYPQEARRAAFGASYEGQRPVRNSAPAGSPGRESLTRTRDRSLLTRCIPRDSE